jgi:hypothetical protein
MHFCENNTAIICLVLTFEYRAVKTRWEGKMAELATEQLIYLLYAQAYLEAGTVTKGTVKSHLSNESKKKAEEIYSALQEQELIKEISKGRFCVTEQGLESLATNLATTDYKFDSAKGSKVLNTLLSCMKVPNTSRSQASPSDAMSFNEFQEKFKALYFEERKQQELRGVVAIRSDELCHQFMEHNYISSEALRQYFERLKSTGKIFAVDEKGSELIQWVE